MLEVLRRFLDLVGMRFGRGGAEAGERGAWWRRIMLAVIAAMALLAVAAPAAWANTITLPEIHTADWGQWVWQSSPGAPDSYSPFVEGPSTSTYCNDAPYSYLGTWVS